jgi:hypothetical protein
VEEILVAVGEKVGYENVAYVSWMNKAVVVKYDNRLYMARTGSQRCSECDDVGHKRHACPKREKAEGGAQVVLWAH